MKIIIIGGVAGGATTAARIRRSDETAEIILLEKGKYIWFLDKLQDSVSQTYHYTGFGAVPVGSKHNKEHTAQCDTSSPGQVKNFQVRRNKGKRHRHGAEYKLFSRHFLLFRAFSCKKDRKTEQRHSHCNAHSIPGCCKPAVCIYHKLKHKKTSFIFD